MKYSFLAVSTLAAMASVGWKLSSHSEASMGLKEISLVQNSEHSRPGPTLASRVRVRISPSDFGNEIAMTTHTVPQVSVVTK